MRFVLLIVYVLLLSCSSGDDGIVTNQQVLNGASSVLCPGITGPQAVYWDQAHGITGQLTQIPLLANPGQGFVHPQYPPVNFTMPAGYTPEVLSGIHTVGVTLLRNDSQAVWRYIPNIAAFDAQVPAIDVIAGEINSVMNFFGFQGQPTVLCSEASQQAQGNFFQDSQSRLIQFGQHTAQVNVLNLYSNVTNSTGISIRVVASRTEEFNNLIVSDWLPLDWQLLVVDENVRDTDADGTPDNQDNFPFDPTRQ